MDFKRISGKQRLVLFLTFCWLAFASMIAAGHSEFRWNVFFGIGIFPVTFVFGAVWTIAGFLNGRSLSEPFKGASRWSAARFEGLSKRFRSGAVGIGGFLLTFFVVGISGAVSRVLVKDLFNNSQQYSQADLIKGLQQAADQINSSGPKMVDEFTRLDRAEVGPGALITYHMSLPHSQLSQIDVSTFSSAIADEVRGRVCENAEMQPPLRYGGAFSYVYLSSDGHEVARFQIAKADCVDVLQAGTNGQ